MESQKTDSIKRKRVMKCEHKLERRTFFPSTTLSLPSLSHNPNSVLIGIFPCASGLFKQPRVFIFKESSARAPKMWNMKKKEKYVTVSICDLLKRTRIQHRHSKLLYVHTVPFQSYIIQFCFLSEAENDLVWSVFSVIVI